MNAGQIVLAVLAVTILAGVAGIWAFQRHAIYRFDSTPQTPAEAGVPEAEVAAYRSEDGATVHAWVLPPRPGRPVILAFHGNSARIGPSFRRLVPLTDDGTGLVMMEYRGSGATGGRPSEAAFARDARALYDQLDTLLGQPVPAGRRVLEGFSLGAGVGSRLAAERPFAAVILEAAPLRSCLYYQDRWFGIPFCRLLWSERYDIVDHLARITAPKLLVHGERDAVLPLWHLRRLAEAAPEPTEVVVLPGGGHSDLDRHGLVPAIRDFLTRRLGP